jgi:hypothetical protein
VEEKKSYYAIIPANVRYDAELTPNAKLLYGEITALCNEKGYCFAKNEYFAKLYNTSEKTITRWIKNLADKDYIETDITTFRYDDGTIKKMRFIYIDKNVRNQEEINVPDHTDKNVPNHTDKNESYNNTINNNTPINIIKKERKTSYDAILSGVTDADLKGLYLEYIKMRKLIKAPMTDRALQMLINKVNDLEPYSIDNQKQLLETAIMNNWKSVYPLRKGENNVQPNPKRSGEEYAFLE